MPQNYQTNRTINRTYRRPTRTCRPLGLCDPQSLLPYGWCESCGKEIYQTDHSFCPRCLVNVKLKIEN